MRKCYSSHVVVRMLVYMIKPFLPNFQIIMVEEQLCLNLELKIRVLGNLGKFKQGLS